MSQDDRPLLAFDQPSISGRPAQAPRDVPRVSAGGGARQGGRLGPQFGALTAAFAAERAQLGPELPDEVDPALVVVFDLAGTVKDLHAAINRVEGLEFLLELTGEDEEPTDDFHWADRDGRKDKPVPHALYLAMSNARAVDELVAMFELWQHDEHVKLPDGLNRFKPAFAQLSAIRRWGPEDRVRESGLLERWREWLDLVGRSQSSVKVEIELWYRTSSTARQAAQDAVEAVIGDSHGSVLDRAHVPEIGYQAVLAELPIQQVRSVLSSGAGSIELLVTEAVMFVSDFAPMTVTPAYEQPAAAMPMQPTERLDGLPRIALLDGLPMANHDALQGRLIIDDPDELGADYSVASRHHGTAMASLVIHGDLSAPGAPLDRPLYVRPIMRPENLTGHEQTPPNRLLTDLLHVAIRRIVVDTPGQPAQAPSVRLINLAIGDPGRALTRRVSPLGRLLDYLAHRYNLLFIVSAGNHPAPIAIAAQDAAGETGTLRTAAAQAVYAGSMLRGILPPGDALNALTVGATHADGLPDNEVPDTALDATTASFPSLSSATGPGVDRSVKPDIHHFGGRAYFARPAPSDSGTVELELANAAATGPGLRAAAPGRLGATDLTAFSAGTSNATALVTREASRLFDVLEQGAQHAQDLRFPDGQYHPLLVRALLCHACSWREWDPELRAALSLDPQHARRRLTALLGYGALDLARTGIAAANRAVLIAGGSIGRDQRHTYELPLPPSIRAQAGHHRLTITLASLVPTVSYLTRYRAAKVYFDTPDLKLAAGQRIDAEHNSVRRGSLQHEIVHGAKAIVFNDGDAFPIHVDCMDDARRLSAGSTIRYALVGSLEAAPEVSTLVHQEVRQQLQQRVRERVARQLRSST